MPTTYKYETQTVLGTNTTSLTLSNLNNYSATDLEISFALRADTADTSRNLFIRINNDSSSIYNSGTIMFNGVTRTYQNVVNNNAWNTTNVPASWLATGTFCWGRIYLPQYKTSDTRKPILIDIANGQESSNNIYTYFAGGNFNTTVNAITSLTFTFASGNLITGSRATIYSINRNA